MDLRMRLKTDDGMEHLRQRWDDDDPMFCLECYDKNKKIIFEEDVLKTEDGKYKIIKNGEFSYQGNTFKGWYSLILDANFKYLKTEPLKIRSLKSEEVIGNTLNDKKYSI